MSRVQEAFQNQKAFIPFITCGDPDLETTEKLVYAWRSQGRPWSSLGSFLRSYGGRACDSGCSSRALAGGTTAEQIFDMVSRIRQRTQIPIAFMTYANVVFSRGTEAFIKKAAALGVDALILPDVPFEEKEEFDSVSRKYGMDLISLIAPTSRERIRMIAKEASGVCLLCFLPGGNGNQKLDYNRYGGYDPIGEGG